MKYCRFLFVIVVVIAVGYSSHAQESKYEEFIAGNKIYKPGCGWFMLGTGLGVNLKSHDREINSTLNYSFRLKDSYFQVGYHVSSDKFITKYSLQRLNDLYVAYGYRKETNRSNFSVFAGPSYAYGASYYASDSLQHKYYKGFTRIGLIINAELTYKIFYDMGLGISLFASANNRYQAAGLMLHLYLSGAYRGQIE